MSIKELIKEGRPGKLEIREYRTAKGNCQLVGTKSYNITIDEVRSKDFIVRREGIDARLFCAWPVNKKDGSQMFWLLDDGSGFVRQYKDSWNHGGEWVESVTETVYTF